MTWNFVPLSLLLIVAGMAHLVSPEGFMPVMPPSLPAPELAILLTGILEIIAAGALFYRRWRRQTAYTLAVYFALLIPIHVYVAWYAIPVFGVSHPAALWGRTLLQIPLILWALTIGKSVGLPPSGEGSGPA